MNYPPTINDVGFVDVVHNDYRLAPTSPYVDEALDGTDIGVRYDDEPLPPLPPLPGQASDPYPAMNATGIPVDTSLGWALRVTPTATRSWRGRASSRSA